MSLPEPGAGRTLDRRQFLLRGSSGALLVVGGMSTLLAACGGDNEQPSGEGGSPASVGLGKPVVIGSSEGDPVNLDSGATYSFALTVTVGSAVHAYLLRADKDAQLVPDLAEEYDLASPTELRFRLRTGVKFHNGRALEPKDVKASFERILDKETASPFAAGLAALESVEVDGADAVVFKLSQPYAPLPALVTQIPIIPIETADEQKSNPVGAGPYRFRQWDKGNFMEFERFPDYYDPEFAKVEGVRFLPQTDAATLRSSFLAEDSQAVIGFTWPDREALAASGDVNTDTASLNGFQFLCMNTTRKPFDDVRVRQAVNIGLDRKRMAEIVNGPGWAPVSVLINPSSPLYPADLDFPYDPERAKALIQEAGVEGETIEGIIVDIPLIRPLGPVWQEEMEKIGLKLKTRYMQPADLIDRVITRGDYQITQFGDAAPPDPALFLDRYYKSDGSTNVMKYSNPEVDDLLTKATRTADEAERKQLYSQAIKLVDEDAPTFTICQNAANYASQSAVSNFAVTPIYTLDIQGLAHAA